MPFPIQIDKEQPFLTQAKEDLQKRRLAKRIDLIADQYLTNFDKLFPEHNLNKYQKQILKANFEVIYLTGLEDTIEDIRGF